MRRSEGLEVMEADHASTTMRLAYTPGLDTIAGGTPIRMYRQKLFFYFPSPRLFDFQNLYTNATPTAAECDYSASYSLETVTVPIHIPLLPL
jgi:hypothetical protein